MEDNRKPVKTVIGVTEEGIQHVVYTMPEPEKAKSETTTIEMEEVNE